eukprot:3640662-Pyramimonas_sp.AAC.1
MWDVNVDPDVISPTMAAPALADGESGGSGPAWRPLRAPAGPGALPRCTKSVPRRTRRPPRGLPDARRRSKRVCETRPERSTTPQTASRRSKRLPKRS